MAPRDDHDFSYLAHDLSQVLWAIQGRARALAAQLPPPAGGEVALLADHAAAAAAMLDTEAAGIADPAAVLAASWQQALDRKVAFGLPAGACRLRTAGAAPPVALPAHALRRILGNLLANALAARPADVTVDCRLRTSGDRVELEVEDDGPGIAPDLRARLFAPGASSVAAAGRGLGLAGSRELARRWGGELESLGGTGGARFRLTLPAASALAVARHAAADLAAAELAAADSADAPGSLRVLVVDDDLAVREMLQQLLGVMGHEPLLAADHDTALALAASGDLAVAVVDFGLPGRSGLDLAARLRERDPALAVILLSGWGRERELAAAPAGCVDLTGQKPLDVPQLRHLLARAARLTAARRAGRATES